MTQRCFQRSFRCKVCERTIRSVPKRSFARTVQSLSTLLEPTRWRLYRYVAGGAEAVTRDAAADALRISRAAAAFHLDRLVASGLLRAHYRRLEGLSGRAAGRPSKLYRRSRRRFEVAIPQRHHQLLSGLLAEAAIADGPPIDQVARQFGRSLGVRARARLRRGAEAKLAGCVEDVTADLGFEPARTPGGELWARNCPFDPVSRRHPTVVCPTALAIVRGVIEGVGAPGISVRREERVGWCCVVLAPPSDAAATSDDRRL